MNMGELIKLFDPHSPHLLSLHTNCILQCKVFSALKSYDIPHLKGSWEKALPTMLSLLSFSPNPLTTLFPSSLTQAV